MILKDVLIFLISLFDGRSTITFSHALQLQIYSRSCDLLVSSCKFNSPKNLKIIKTMNIET